MKQIEELLGLFGKMNFVEILGFGNLLQIKEEEKFEDYLTNIFDRFQNLSRGERRKILKLAKQVTSGRD